MGSTPTDHQRLNSLYHPGQKTALHQRSEFSHPDIVIVLTSLSYYYGGLDNDDLSIGSPYADPE